MVVAYDIPGRQVIADAQPRRLGRTEDVEDEVMVLNKVAFDMQDFSLGLVVQQLS